MGGIKSYTVTDSFVVPHGKLLEGCTYDERIDTLYYLNIPAGLVFSIPNSSAVSERTSIPKSYKVSQNVGVIGLTTNPSKLVCGTQEGILILDLTNGDVKPIDLFPNGNLVNGLQYRSNDGSIGPDGSFWVGTMHVDESDRNGTMYLLKDKDSKMIKLWSGCGIPNGINWDTNRNVMYWTDSVDRSVYKFNYDAKTNKLDVDSKSLFFKHEFHPDGSCLDVDGNLYVSVWGSNRVIRVQPNGIVDKEWIFPSKNISCCTFGDKNLSTLYVTSASLSESDDANPNDLGATVYKIVISDLGIKGVAKNQFVL